MFLFQNTNISYFKIVKFFVSVYVNKHYFQVKLYFLLFQKLSVQNFDNRHD